MAKETILKRELEHEHERGSLAVFPEVKVKLLRRMRTVVGHIQGIERMIEGERYCTEILKQIAAVQAQLSYISHELTKTHMKSCLTDAISAGEGDEVIEELTEILKYLR
ncbi:MAG: metal-sensitive transcriptional regulator [Candidatus Bipolaricaulia bacterium]